MPTLSTFLTMDFLSAFLSIILVDIVLSGDNAVLIAMAVRNLPQRQRKLGITLGVTMAVILRVILTFFAAQLMGFHYVKLVGGLVIAWIGVKLLVESSPDDASRKECSTLMEAVTTILVADFVMSLDNVLAVAGASKGDVFLLLFGLGLSIPIVMFASNLLSTLMDRYPIILYVGAAVLGKVAVEMVLTDPAVSAVLPLSPPIHYLAQALGAVAVVVAGKLWMRFTAGRPAPANSDCDTAP